MFIIEIFTWTYVKYIIIMIVLRAVIIMSTTLSIIYSDCNFSLLAVLSSGIVSDFALYVINICTVIWPHSDVTWPHSDVTWPHSDVIWPHSDII